MKDNQFKEQMLSFETALQRKASTSNHTEPRLWRPSPPALPKLQLQLLECSHNMPHLCRNASWSCNMSQGSQGILLEHVQWMFRIHPNPIWIQYDQYVPCWKMVKVSLSAVKHLHLLEPLCVEGTAAERLRYHNATVGGWTTFNMVQHLAILYNSI